MVVNSQKLAVWKSGLLYWTDLLEVDRHDVLAAEVALLVAVAPGLVEADGGGTVIRILILRVLHIYCMLCIHDYLTSCIRLLDNHAGIRNILAISQKIVFYSPPGCS